MPKKFDSAWICLIFEAIFAFLLYLLMATAKPVDDSGSAIIPAAFLILGFIITFAMSLVRFINKLVKRDDQNPSNPLSNVIGLVLSIFFLVLLIVLVIH